MKLKDLKLIIGLGNPGEKYQNTFHNVGILIVQKLEALLADKESPFEEFITLKGFMNHSGTSLATILRSSKYDLGNCLIVHDDSDLNLGEYKISFDKNAAGQRGVQNIIDQFGTKEFWRLRIGVRNPKEKTRRKAGDFVLSKIPPFAGELLDEVAKKALVEILA